MTEYVTYHGGDPKVRYRDIKGKEPPWARDIQPEAPPVYGPLLHQQVALLGIAEACKLNEAAYVIREWLTGILDGYEQFYTVEQLIAAVKEGQTA
jgi:hypothetical protein